MKSRTFFALAAFCLFSSGATSMLAAEHMKTTAVSAGATYGLAVRSDGTVWAWGTNRFGELGLGGVTQANAPRRIQSLSNVAGVSAGQTHSLAVTTGGQVWAWGTNSNGQLGNGSTTSATTPVQTSIITNALMVSAGANHSLAVLKDGRVMAWGANGSGQLGRGNTTPSTAPVQVNTLTNAIQAVASSNFSIALTASGEVWSWGYNGQGQLGLGNTTTQQSPVKITTLSNIVQIAAGASHALARASNGTLYAWGRNAEGQMGDGTTTASTSPKVVLNIGLTNVFGPAKWISGGFNSSAAISSNGKICYWGSYSNNATYFGTANVPVQIGVAVDETFTTVHQGEYFLLAIESNGASVWAWGLNSVSQWGNDNPQTDDWRYEFRNPSYSFGARPRALMARFSRGDRANLAYNSFVLPLDLEQGVRLNAEGSEQYCYQETPWFLRVQKNTRQHVFKRVGSTTNVTRFPVENPIAAYGSEAGGNPLYAGQPYTFGVYAGAFNENTTATNAIRVLVYSRAALAAGTNNVAPTNVFTIRLPRRNITADNTLWSNYVTNGNRVLVETNGLRTTVEFADDPDNTAGGYHNWGVQWQFAIAPNVILGGYRITHTATSTNFCYVIEVQGQAEVGANVFAPMTTNTTGWAYSPMYALGFEEFPEWRARFLDGPHFQGVPLPPTYAGRSVAELNGLMAVVTNNFWLTNNAAYTNLDTSPELRRHPLLDRFVEDMGRNPLALASYVLNEIELTDPLGYIEAAQRVNDSVEVGGVNRSALGTFLEGQGSPTEQCALLVYLLRRAGYSAGYAFPTNNNLRLLDTTISRLWQINVKGVVFHAGVPVITNSLVAVNYPWVVANIGTNCIHIFPWLKNTEIVEGLDIYDYMPTNHFKAYQWVKDYSFANSNVLGTVSVNEPMMKAWRQYMSATLNAHPQARNLSLDDFGVRAFNRRDVYSSWDELPRPNSLTNQTQVSVVPTLSESPATYPFLTNMFDRVRIEVFRTDTNIVNRIFDTGFWRACDFHNRKLLLYTNTTTSATLWLAPYRPDATNATGNFTGFETGLGSLNKQVVTASVASGVTLLPVRITYQRRISQLTLPGGWYPAREYFQDSFHTTPLKRDVTAIIPSVARVSPAMLRVHAEDYWRLEQQRAQNPAFTPDVTEDAGTTGMLLASSFFEKLWTDDQFNQRLHKVRGLTWNSWGIAALTKQSGGLMQLKLNMNWFATQILGNARMRQDSSDRSLMALDDYLTMLQAHGSSAEHSVITSLFDDGDSVSSVRLLQLAAERNRTSGMAAPLELNIKNYVSLGNASYTGYGSTLLKNQDPAFWQRVTNEFTKPAKDFTRVLITPGPVTNTTGSFKGMSALIFGKSQTGALLSDNSVILNGGWSAQLYYVAPPTFNTYQLTYSLQYSPTFGYSFAYNNFSTPQPRFTFSQHELPTLTASTGAVRVAFTPQQSSQAQLITTTLSLAPSTTTAQAIKTSKDVGWIDRAQAGIKQFASKMADPVHVVSGDFYVDEVDLTLAGPLPLQLRRNYLSRTLAENHFGPGWKLSFTPWLVLSTNAQGNALIHAAEPDGAVLAYRFQSSDLWTITVEDNPSLVNFTESGIGSTANLFHNRIQRYATNGTTYVLTAADGSKRTYQVMSGFGLSSGTNYLDRVRPYLTRWEDHAGNHHEFYYGTNSANNDFGHLQRVVSANGAVLTLKYDVSGRIIEAITDDARRVLYEYDRHGDLVRVTLPDHSEHQYEYQHYTFSTNGVTYTDSNHLLAKHVQPSGRILANQYDNLRRVIVQAATVGTNRELVTNAWFFYTNNITSLTNEYITGVTRVEDVFHNAYLYQYTSNLITRIEEPTGRVTVQDWFEGNETAKPGYYPRSLEFTIDPRGLTNEFRYDAQGNVTNQVVRGNLTGEGVSNQTATNTYTYNSNQLLTSVVDPSGNKKTIVYDDANDPYRPLRVEWSHGGTGISTNRFSYTNVTETTTQGSVVKTNRAFGLLTRLVRADTATNEWSYNGRGFITQSTRHAKAADYPANTDPPVVSTFSYTARGDLSDRIDSAGRRWRFSYDAMGRLQWRDVFDETEDAVFRDAFYYNRNGELEWYDGPRTGPEDYIWFNYDGAGRKVQEMRWRSRAKDDGTGVEAELGDDLYATFNYRYDPFGNLTRMVNPRGAVVTNVWDALGRLVQQKALDFDGSTVLSSEGFAYEPGHLIRFHTNALGGVTEIQYTSTGQPSFRRNPDGSTNGWTYYLDGRLKREFQQNGAYWETTYNDADRSVTRLFYKSGGTPLATNSWHFDRRKNVIRAVDAAGNSYTNLFDGLDRLKWSVGPRIVFTNPPGLPQIGDPPPPIQQAVTNFYDAAGIIVTNVNALGEKTISRADALGRPVSLEIRSASNTVVRVVSITYAADHHSFTVANGSGADAIVHRTFTDNDGRTVLVVNHPFPNSREFVRQVYDLVGNLTFSGHYSAEGGDVRLWSQASHSYDSLNRIRSSADRDFALTTFDYDAAGNLTNRVMPGGLKWRAELNQAGQMLKSYNLAPNNEGTRTNTYSYYQTNSAFAGRLLTHTDGRGVVRTTTYDDFLRPLTNTYAGPQAEHNFKTVVGYDVRGFVTSLTENFTNPNAGPTTVVQRSYDPYGLLATESVSVNGVQHSGATLTWNSAGRRDRLAISSPSSTINYGFGWLADGSLAGISAPWVSGSYGYTTAGLVKSRNVNGLAVSVLARDGAGRVLEQESKVNGVTRLNETLTRTGDGLLATHSVARTGDFTDLRSYDYAPWSRRLALERTKLDATKGWTNVFSYDEGASGGAGVLTQVAEPHAGGASWSASLDPFVRIERETNNVIRRMASGRMNAPFGQATLSVNLDGRALPLNTLPTSDPNWPVEWRTVMELRPGPHVLQAVAAHSSGQFVTNRSATFTNNAVDQTTVSHFADGQLSYRVWRNSSGQTNRVQTLVWDARSRLIAATELDAANNGYQWSAAYDALGRRLQTTTVIVTNGTALTASPRTIRQVYDPSVEFLELGVRIEGKTTWKIYGPDLDGRYGGWNGTGGLDGLTDVFGMFRPVLTDSRGDVHGHYDLINATLLWNTSRPTGYGAVPEYRPVPLADNGDLAVSSAWRGRWPDLTGLYWLGARYYDPVAGRFISADPLGHDADPSLYGFAHGDPVNYFDPDGRIATQFYNEGFPSTVQMRALGNWMIDVSDNSSSYWSMFPAFAGQLLTDVSAMGVPRNHVDGAIHFGGNVRSLYHEDGLVVAGSYALTSWNVGAIWEGYANVDLATGEAVGDGVQRGQRFLGGVAGTAGVASGGLRVGQPYIPKPTVAPPPLPRAQTGMRVQPNPRAGEFGGINISGANLPRWKTNPHLAGKTPLPGTRGTGVSRARQLEAELVQRTGKGTVDWSPTEIQYIRQTGQLPDGIVGHHINNVAHYPEWAGDPRNIRFVRGQTGNLAEHGGSFGNSTTGPLLDRAAMIQQATGGTR